MTHNVLIADDHPILRLGLVGIIESDKKFHVVAETGDGNEALSLIEKLRPAIAVLDITMPGKNGIEVCRKAQKSAKKTAVVILSMHSDVDYLNEALDAGAKGYVLKANAADDLLIALKSVLAGKPYISSTLSGLLETQKQSRAVLKEKVELVEKLTGAEKKVLALIAQKRTSKEIAQSLGVNFRTVQTHRMNICKKLGLNGWNMFFQFVLENKPILQSKWL